MWVVQVYDVLYYSFYFVWFDMGDVYVDVVGELSQFVVQVGWVQVLVDVGEFGFVVVEGGFDDEMGQLQLGQLLLQ